MEWYRETYMDKMNEIMKQLQNVLESQVEALEPAPFQPVDEAEWEWETVSFDGTQKDNSAWLVLISEYIRSATIMERKWSLRKRGK